MQVTEHKTKNPVVCNDTKRFVEEIHFLPLARIYPQPSVVQPLAKSLCYHTDYGILAPIVVMYQEIISCLPQLCVNNLLSCRYKPSLFSLETTGYFT